MDDRGSRAGSVRNVSIFQALYRVDRVSVSKEAGAFFGTGLGAGLGRSLSLQRFPADKVRKKEI